MSAGRLSIKGQKESRHKRYDACDDDVAETEGFEPSCP